MCATAAGPAGVLKGFNRRSQLPESYLLIQASAADSTRETVSGQSKAQIQGPLETVLSFY